MVTRVELDTKIEREVHRLVKEISEGTYDRLQMFARRQGLQIDPQTLNVLLGTMQTTIHEFELMNIDRFHQNVKKELDAYVGDTVLDKEVVGPLDEAGDLGQSPQPQQKPGKTRVKINID